MAEEALRSRAGPSVVLPILCSAGLVAAVYAAEFGRLYRAQSRRSAKVLSRSPEEPRAAQQGRALQPGRGRHATSPWQIPWRGWKDILWRTYERIGEDRLLAVAAGVVFYGLLALFPAVTAMVSLYGLFAKASTISEHLSAAAGLLPESAMSIVRDQVDRLAAKGDAKLGFGFVIGLAVALWSANSGMKAILDALNVVYEEKEKRGFIKLNLVSLCFTLAAIASFLLALGAVVIMPIALNYLGLHAMTDFLLRGLRWPLLLALIIIGLAVLYRFGPSRREPRWQWISVGSVVAALAWLAASALLSWYLAHFANYDATYGSLGAAIGLMMWMWITSIVILFGAELNSEIEHQTARDWIFPLRKQNRAVATERGRGFRLSSSISAAVSTRHLTNL
jgi:membrane protein